MSPYIEYDDEEDNEPRECSNSCPHFDSLNLCCWQSGIWGLCFDTQEGNVCSFGYKEEVDIPRLPESSKGLNGRKKLGEKIQIDKTWLLSFLREIESDPEEIKDKFCLKWRDDDAMMCLASFIREKLLGEKFEA